MYQCKHFKAYELVSKSIYEKRGNKAYQCIDERLLQLLDTLRELLDSPMTINSWQWGGNRNESGLRTPESSYYSNTSQHSYGRAVDFLVKGMTADEVRKKVIGWMRDGTIQELCGVESITLELGVSWVHIDVRNNDAGVNSFYP